MRPSRTMARPVMRASRPPAPRLATSRPPSARPARPYSPAVATRQPLGVTRPAVPPPARPSFPRPGYPGRPYPRRFRRRYWRGYPLGWWYSRWGIDGGGYAPPPLIAPELDQIHPWAQRALARLGLLANGWRERLAQASPLLVEFINRFYWAPGFEHVTAGFFGGRSTRQAAQMAARFAFQLQQTYGNLRGRLSFGRTRLLAPDGRELWLAAVKLDGRVYKPRGWGMS